MDKDYRLRFLGVGSAMARDLGQAAAVLEDQQHPLLLIDCGPDVPAALEARYGCLPAGIFISHAHFDHIGGLEALFYRLRTRGDRPPLVRLFVAADLVPVLQRRLADYPNILAEGNANFWDVFQLVPVSRDFWLAGLRFRVFQVRHHDYASAYGLALPGRFLYSGDTRPIPEVLNTFASQGEWIFHDCGVHSNPSHSAVEDLLREYRSEQIERLIVYHYASEAEGEQLRAAGLRVALPGQAFVLAAVSGDVPAPAEVAAVTDPFAG